MSEVPSMRASRYYELKLYITNGIFGGLTASILLAIMITGGIHRTPFVLYGLIPMGILLIPWIALSSTYSTLRYGTSDCIPDRMHMNTKEEYAFKCRYRSSVHEYDVLVKVPIFLNFYTYLDTTFKVGLPVRQDDPPTDYEIQQAWVDRKIKWQAENSKTTVIV